MSFSSNSISNVASGPDEPIAKASFYSSKKSKKPFFTFNSVISCAAVYPDNEAVLTSSSIFRIEGLCEWDSGYAEVPKGLDLQARRISVTKSVHKGEPHATVIVMPEDAGRNPQAGMLSWVLAFADAFRVRLFCLCLGVSFVLIWVFQLFGRSPTCSQVLYDVSGLFISY